MTQFLKKVFMHTTVYNYVFFFKDIFYKYLKISEYLIAKNWPFIKNLIVTLKQKKNFKVGIFRGSSELLPFCYGK